jgi:hypothetical protein
MTMGFTKRRLEEETMMKEWLRAAFTLTDGKLRAEAERGWSEVTLYEEGDRRMLKVTGTTNDGVQYSAELALRQ